ncbi:hypothetical protein [Burkholderia sp. BCC1047]|uniref:hypothetical protein n=1 Tax=Burkholderia sp. BCC1047 TaxID=2676299 RepID=UPI00158B058C|nr:hypothetical protein [Burkholderia sp. BCC1047]
MTPTPLDGRRSTDAQHEIRARVRAPARTTGDAMKTIECRCLAARRSRILPPARGVREAA